MTINNPEKEAIACETKAYAEQHNCFWLNNEDEVEE